MARGRRAVEAAGEREFREFAEARQRDLRRSAYLLCGDWHEAEDLTQTTLMKLYATWGRVRRRGDVEAQARIILTRTFVDQYRRRGRREEPVREVPELPAGRGASPPEPELGLVLQARLMELPPRYRAVLVLRFWEDWSVEQTAQALRVSTGTVKSHSAKGLSRLRRLIQQGDGEVSRR